jgi:ADP-ribose pyrophosphatase YjhB (NUDIX family)
MKKILTLAFLLTEEKICLAMKKRGFGEAYWNGFGGKVHEEETVEKCTIREIEEESGVKVLKEDLKKVALIEFLYPDDLHLEVHTFFIAKWEGDPKETEEMRPEWFLFRDIPYDHMWADDPHWLPRVLRGEKLTGKVWFNEDGKTIKEMVWNQVEHLN